jgi:rhodanese-related sulfurtransferase
MNPSNPSSSPDIKADELLSRMNSGEALRLLDVREPIEYHTHNIGGTNIPLSNLPAALEELKWDSQEEIIVVCKAGIRSRTAQSILRQNGYTCVRNLTGGLLAVQKLKY